MTCSVGGIERGHKVGKDNIHIVEAGQNFDNVRARVGVSF